MYYNKLETGRQAAKTSCESTILLHDMWNVTLDMKQQDSSWLEYGFN